MSAGIVGSALLQVLEDSVGLGDFFEPLLGIGLLVAVGMVFQHKLPARKKTSSISSSSIAMRSVIRIICRRPSQPLMQITGSSVATLRERPARWAASTTDILSL